MKLPEVCIRNTGDTSESGHGGIDSFRRFLTGITGWIGFEKLTDILIVADNDLSPDRNFQRILAQIADVPPFGIPPNHFAVPEAPLTIARGTPSITILMIPWTNVQGNLECLCLKAAEAASPDLAAQVREFAPQTLVEEWPEITLQGKMKLRSLLAVRHKPDPFIGLGRTWVEDPTLIPLDSAELENVKTVLRDFCTR